MTGNVAQVFLSDDAWAATLSGLHAERAPRGAASWRLEWVFVARR